MYAWDLRAFTTARYRALLPLTLHITMLMPLINVRHGCTT
jgi:hypothetical protein